MSTVRAARQSSSGGKKGNKGRGHGRKSKSKTGSGDGKHVSDSIKGRKAWTKYNTCGAVGHWVGDPECPGRMQDTAPVGFGPKRGFGAKRNQYR